jgi:hypothetical protein
MTLDENNAIEEYNRQFNERASRRPVRNLIVCIRCSGTGRMYIPTMSYYEGIDDQCHHCNKTGYINNGDPL